MWSLIASLCLVRNKPTTFKTPMHPTDTVTANSIGGRTMNYGYLKWTAIIAFLIVFPALAFLVLVAMFMFVAGGD
jgi:hypothetical protein